MSLLAIQLCTLFVLSSAGRIERENDPDRSAGPRLWIAGCASGNIVAVRRDVPDDVAMEIATLAAAEPAFASCDGSPRRLDRYVDLLSRDGRVPQKSLGLIHELPHDLPHTSGAELIDDQSQEGRRFLEVVLKRGMPDGLAEVGFRCASDLWPPWCIVRVDGKEASIAFAARISEVGAEVGVATVETARGRGYAAAAVASWSRLQTLRPRQLFYSVGLSNLSSRRVAARLGLRRLGASLRLS